MIERLSPGMYTTPDEIVDKVNEIIIFVNNLGPYVTYDMVRAASKAFDDPNPESISEDSTSFEDRMAAAIKAALRLR